MFGMFDQLMLMAQGRTIYMNSASKAVPYFTSIGYPCPQRTNPADYFMEIMSIESYDDVDAENEEEVQRSKSKIEESYKEKIIYFNDKYEESELRSDPDSLHPDAKDFSEQDVTEYRPKRVRQFWLLLMRSFKNIFRLPLASYAKTMTYLITSIIVILVYGHLNHDTQSIQTRNGVIFLTLLLYVMNPIQGAVLLFPDERPVFLREQGGNMYSPTMYYVAKMVSELPMLLIN